MKISHKSRKAAPVHPQVADLITELLNTPNNDLPDVLSGIDAWQWPRSDLHAWVNVLNKFDAILEEIIREYDVEKIQLKEFTPVTKGILCGILRFERLLLENSTNRKTFNSYDRINSLLFSSDLDILVLALNLLLRPAQQYSAQQSVAQALSISTSRLQSLAKRWPQYRDDSVNLVDLASDAGSARIALLPQEAREVHFVFYSKDEPTNTVEKESSVFDAQPPQTPSRKGSAVISTAAPGAIHVNIDSSTLQSKSPMEVLSGAIETYGVPDSEKFDLLCRIQTATALSRDNQEDRTKLVIVRLLAIAIFCHTHTESQANASLFLFEPDLIMHLAELLHLDGGVPVAAQTAAIAALDSLARYKMKIIDVLAAVNAGVNHGILMALLRHTVNNVTNPESTLPHFFVEALLSFVTFLASHGTGGNMVVAAGLVPLLIQTMENRLPNRLLMVSKTMQLLDNVLYGFANAFQLFCASRGVDVLVERIQYEIDLNIEHGGDKDMQHESIATTYGHLSVARAAVLKHSLRSMHRMMQSSGTSEGLRGLIDSSLLKSLRKIMLHRSLFGPSVFSIAINIMATFVHNEPTSLTVVQEAGLPEVFYQAVEVGLEPVIEVIQAIPNALGALCLNQAGQDQLASRPTIIPGLFTIFTSERHLKVLQDKENAVLIGTAIDELIRHHPLVKGAVFEALKSTLSKIEDMGHAFTVPDELKPWYRLIPVPPTTSTAGDIDVTMASPSGSGPTAPEPLVDAEQSPTGEELPRSHDNIVVSFIDITGRFLDGLFQHPHHCRDFITIVNGLERLGKLTALPCLPYDFANSVSSDSIVQVIRTLADAAPNETLTFLSNLVKDSLADTTDFWNTFGEKSKLLPLVDLNAMNEEEGNRRFRKLVTLQTRATLLSEVYATAGYSHGRFAPVILQSLAGRGSPEVIPDLGALHRTCIWENIVFKKELASQGIVESTANDPLSPGAAPSGGPAAALPISEIAGDNGDDILAATAIQLPSALTKPPGESKSDTAQDLNARALRHVVTQLPTALAPLFQAIVKLFNINPRRPPEASQKKQIMDAAHIVANTMLKHVAPHDIDDQLSLYAYQTVVLGLVTVLVVDERSPRALHTVLLSAFYKVGGLIAVLNVCDGFMASVEKVNAVNADARTDAMKQELVHACGGLKVFLHLIQPIISSKLLFEAGQTVLLLTPDKKDTDPSYFEPHSFLVKLRTAVIPTLTKLWTAQWLLAAPLGVIKSVVQGVLELIKGENEEVQGTPAEGPPGHALVPGIIPQPPPGPDENRIRQLTDMGFPRRIAETALLRTRNNVAAAADFLLLNPFPFAMDARGDAPEPMEEDPVAEEPPAATPVAEEDQATEATPAAVSSEDVQESESTEKSNQQWLKELNELREPLRSDVCKHALRLVDEHPSLIFEVQSMFTGSQGSYQQQGLRQLIEDVKIFSPSAFDVQEQPMAVRCRLLALALNQPVSQDALSSDTKNLMDLLRALLLSKPGPSAEHNTSPKWMAPLLLVVEALLVIGEQPQSITLPNEDEPIVQQELCAGPFYPEARSKLFDICMQVLSMADPPFEELLSSLRIFIVLTRNHDYATEFVKRNGVTLLLSRLKSSVQGDVAVKSHIMIILRHIVEDPQTIKQIMQLGIKRCLNNPKTRFADVPNYVRGCSSLALRDPKAFIDATGSICELSKPSASGHVLLKAAVPDDKKLDDKNPEGNQGKPESSEADMQIDSASAAPITPTESLESLVHIIVSELMSSVKATTELVTTPSHAASQMPSMSSGPVAVPPTVDSKSDAHLDPGHTAYCCFLMQSLTELLFSYDVCKLAFLSYSPKKRPQTPAKDNSNKHRTAGLHFLLYDLISFGPLNSQQGEQSRHRITLCNWAMSVIVALCVDSSLVNDMKDVPTDLVSVRKFVLEAINRAIKELPVSEKVDARYGRLLALSDLCYRLLTVRPHSPPRKQQDDVPTHIAKIMLEKNYVATLTTAMGEVDLNYPGIRSVVSAVLRPLEFLTKVAIKMSRTSDKAKDAGDQGSDSGESAVSDGEDEEMGEDGREETPDLYRNSALGMYGGEMENAHYQANDNVDDGGDEADEDVEMDFGDDTGSEDTSNSGDGEDGLAQLDGSEDAWRDENDEDADEDEEGLIEHDEEHGDEDDDDDEDEDEDGDEDEDDVDEEGDEEMLWQGGDDGQGPVVDDDDVELVGGLGEQVAHQDDEEAEAMSEEDGFPDDARLLEAQDEGGAAEDEVFEFIDDLPGAMAIPIMDPTNRGPRRRVTDDEVDIFGRVRNGPPPSNDAVMHPLLFDTTSQVNRASSSQSRARRTQRNETIQGQNVVWQSIADVLGTGAVQVFQQLMSHSWIADGMDVLEQAQHQRHPRGATAQLRFSGRPRPGDNRAESRSFSPLQTSHRWAEEIKIIHGKAVQDRLHRLQNHVTLLLMPAAIQAAKDAKALEDEKAKQREAEVQAEEEANAKRQLELQAEASEPSGSGGQDDMAHGSSTDVAPTAAPDAPEVVDPNMSTHIGSATPQHSPPAVLQPILSETPLPEPPQPMIASPAEPAPSPPSEAAQPNVSAPTTVADTPMADGESVPAPTAESVQSSASTVPEASTSQPVPPQVAARVTVMIHGSPVDITDTGIDPTFLEALPDDMREEVLNQHVRDQRAARVERPADSQISSEFLDALPPEIRAEILQQESIERARRRVTETVPAPPNVPAAPADIDPASFIASLDPQLRQVVLLDQDDGFIQSLPSHMIAEAAEYRDVTHHRRVVPARLENPRQLPVRKVASQRDAIQLVDKTGVAVLIRLLFFPQALRKNLLFKVLVHLCENTKTRTEVFNVLINVLQDGTGDLAAIDKSFAQLSFRSAKPPILQTPKSTGKQRTGSEYLAALALTQSEANPELIAQRCWEGLTYIVNHNQLSSLFFLTEQELPPSLKRTASKKGKGKEKLAPQTYYPVVLLLGLLDRQSLLKAPSTMEAVVSLLAMVTKPLTGLQIESKGTDTAIPDIKVGTAVAEIQGAGASETPASGSSIPSATTSQEPAAVAAPTAPSTSETPAPTATSTGTVQPEASIVIADHAPSSAEEKLLLERPPHIPQTALRLIVNILTMGDCSAKTFQQSLALIQHLSFIPDAREEIAQELRARAQGLGQSIILELHELSSALENPQSPALVAATAKFSPASSDQAKLLRVLKTIDYMYSLKATSPDQISENAERVQNIYESFRFSALWSRLGDCLAIIEQKPETEHIATVLLPLIEALMVVCKHVGSATSNASRIARASSVPKSPLTARESMEDLFVAFTDAHRKVLNVMVRNNPSLMSGSFALLVHNPRVLDFDNKRSYFTVQVHRRAHAREHHSTLQLNVRRARVFEDSFQYLQRKSGDQIKYGKLSVRFYDEEGVDAGGLTREWFQILARQMFNPGYALFQPCVADKATYQPNRASWVNPEHLSFFKFVGRVIGKAIFDGRLLDAYFARSFYRQLLGKPVDYRDVEWVDPEYYNSLCWILENDPTPLDLTFSVEADEFGVNKIIHLKENGASISVTQENKKEFVQLSASYRLYTSIKDQIEALLAGFYDIIPKDLVSIFNEQEVELLISGTPDVDVDEWRAATEYHGYTASEPVIVWWWRALKSFNREERAKVLSFATGTSRVPLGGFTELQGVQGVQKFSIHRAYGDSDRLPQAHTCFNQIDLPEYSSYEKLRHQLMVAINEGGEGFGFA